MFPLKDNLPTARTPVVTLALVLLTVLAIPLWDAPPVPLLLAAWALWIAGRSVEDSVSQPVFLLFCGAAAAAAGGVQSLTASLSESSAPIVCLVGLAAGVVGAYIRLYPRAKVLAIVLIPVFASMVEAPARILACCWLVLQAGLTFTGVADGLEAWTPAATALLGGAVVPALRPRRNAVYERVVAPATASVPPS